jgi:hypothetical protein
MKRDMEVIRRLLLYFNAKDGPEMAGSPDIGREYPPHVVQYHLRLMCEAGWLNYEAERSSTSHRIIRVYPFDLTWEGHEFLAKITTDGVWPKLETMIASRGGSMAVSVMNLLATKLALEAAGLKS